MNRQSESGFWRADVAGRIAEKTGHLIVMGDNLKAQNGFGTWRRDWRRGRYAFETGKVYLVEVK